jgi:hypothetical protein
LSQRNCKIMFFCPSSSLRPFWSVAKNINSYSVQLSQQEERTGGRLYLAVLIAPDCRAIFA